MAKPTEIAGNGDDLEKVLVIATPPSWSWPVELASNVDVRKRLIATDTELVSVSMRFKPIRYLSSAPTFLYNVSRSACHVHRARRTTNGVVIQTVSKP